MGTTAPQNTNQIPRAKKATKLAQTSDRHRLMKITKKTDFNKQGPTKHGPTKIPNAKKKREESQVF